jgi:hypothetical protein
MADRLATLADLKAMLGQSGTVHDGLLSTLLDRATALAQRLAGRPLCRREQIAEFPGGPQSCYLRLRVAPIESVQRVTQLYAPASAEQHAAADALVQDADYIILPDEGVLERINGVWLPGQRRLHVVYTGGFADPAAEQPPAARQPTADLQHAVIQQAIRWFNTRDTAGLRQLDFGDRGGSVSLAETDIHPELRAAATGLRRWSL